MTNTTIEEGLEDPSPAKNSLRKVIVEETNAIKDKKIAPRRRMFKIYSLLTKSFSSTFDSNNTLTTL
jgi:hypothetical protein